MVETYGQKEARIKKENAKLREEIKEIESRGQGYHLETNEDGSTSVIRESMTKKLH